MVQVLSLYSRGDHRAALELAEEALATYPNSAVLLNVAATNALAVGATAIAEGHWQRAVALNPGYATAHYNLGVLYALQSRRADAERNYSAAIAANPRHVDAHVNLGAILHEQGRCEEAQALFERALEMEPNRVDLLYNLAAVLTRRQRPAEAEAIYRRVLELKPDHEGAYNNLGVLYRGLKRFAESEQAYRAALAVNPRDGGTYRNMGLLMQGLARFDQAEHYFRQALALNDADADARWSLGMLLLYRGRFEEGWAYYESRYAPSLRHRTIDPPQLPFPQWRGESLAGKSILIWPEQALGDEVQICRYAAVLKGMGASWVTFVCKPLLKSLLQDVDGIDLLLSRNEASVVREHDFWTLQFSIPLCCATRVDNIPATIPYLHAKPPYVQRLQPLLHAVGGLRVGLCWQGSSKYPADADRSPGLGPFAPLFALTGARFFTLLPGTRAQFRAHAGPAACDLGHEIDEDTPPFEETLALVSGLDLVISSDTSVAHVAAAAGRPVWLVLPFVADWRWMHGREDTPWYPNMRLFRQNRHGDWQEVFERVRSRLLDVLAGHGERLWPTGAAAQAQRPAEATPVADFERMPKIPVSWGEVFDKLTILEIKLERMSDPNQLTNIRRERDEIAAVVAQLRPLPTALATRVERLRQVNAELWDIENGKRECERTRVFDDRFIRLARQVYIKNDERAAVKKDINLLLGSRLVEEKSHTAY